MLRGKTIFILSLMKFDGPTSTNFTIAKYLAKENDVYYIEHPLTLKDYLKLDKKSNEYKIRSSGLGFFSNGLLTSKIDGVNIIVSVPVIPSHSLKSPLLYKMITWINQRLTCKRIKRIIREKKIDDFIFINAYDFKFPDIGAKLKPKLTAYYCVDPIPDYDRPFGIIAEEKLVKGSDIVICTSKALYEEKKLLNENTYFVPNGADIVDIGSLENVSRPSVLQNIKEPIIGYIGAVERRMDYELINNITERLNNYKFVFVGPAFKEHIPDWFWKKDNIIYIEPIPYNEVPAMIKAFDVTIIPFKKDDISRNIFPLKLFEYLGVGKPVVVSDFNTDLKDFSDEVVTFASDPDTFADAIVQSLEEKSDALAQKRIMIASQNTWKDRCERISSILLKHLGVPQARVG